MLKENAFVINIKYLLNESFFISKDFKESKGSISNSSHNSLKLLTKLERHLTVDLFIKNSLKYNIS